MSSAVVKSARLLVIDDDPGMSLLIAGLIESPRCTVTTALNLEQGVTFASRQKYDVIILDHLLPDGCGLDRIESLLAQDRFRPLLFVTAQSSSQNAIEAIKRGAFDYLTKPLDFGLLKKRLLEALEYRQLTSTPVLLENSIQGIETPQLVGRCRAMHEVYKSVGRLANTSHAALIEGEIGTGKELISRTIHSNSLRQNSAFMKMSAMEFEEVCRGTSDFSLERLIPNCVGGTLFVEDLSVMSKHLQFKLLTCFQTSELPEQSSVRFIVSTSMPIRQLLDSGLLRSDLYYYLCPYTVRVPLFEIVTEI